MLRWCLKKIMYRLPLGNKIIKVLRRFALPRPFLPSDEVSFRHACDLVVGNDHVQLPINDEVGAWYTQKPLIWAHAGGARQILFANTKEAIDDSIRQGFNVIEVDVSVTSDGVAVLSHNFRPNNEEMFKGIPKSKRFQKTPICGKYTPLSLSDLWEIYSGWNGYFAIDQTISSLRPGFNLVEYMKRVAPPSFLKKVIYLAYRLDELQDLKNNSPFASVHFCLFPPPPIHFLPYLIRALAVANVHSVSFGDMEITDDIQLIVAKFIEANIYVSVAHVNDLEKLRKWRGIGVRCINSDYLIPRDLKVEENINGATN